MSDVYSVKGSTIRMKFEFVRDRFGPEAEAAMRARFRNRMELEALLDTSWVPFTLYEEINQYIARAHYGGDLTRLREVGAYSADRGLQSIYKIWVSGKAFLDFLRQMTEYNRTLYNAGDLDVSVGEDQTSATLSFRNAPQYSQAELHTSTGFFVGSAKVMGLADVTHEAKLVPKGMEITLRWR
jgi:hypothetical protein